MADEVRSLAKQSQESTDKIQSMIEQFQIGTKDAASVMLQASKQVETSVVEADSAESTLRSITASASEICDLTEQMASALEQQSVVADEINSNVAIIADIADKTSQFAHQVTAASGDVGNNMANLANLIARFNTGEDASSMLADAKIAHLTWKQRLRAYLDGKAMLTEKEAVSHQHCMFGRWYYGPGLKSLGHIAAMRDIEAPHTELHRLIGEIIRMGNAGKKDEAEALYEKVEPLSLQIVGYIDDIQSELNSRPTKVA